MKVVIAGSRTLDRSTDTIEQDVTDSGFDISEVVTGGAPGIDTAAIEFAHAFGLPLTVMPAIWRKGPKAGPMRNARMAAYADALILVWDGVSKGSRSMKREAEKRGLPIYEVVVAS